MASKKYNSGGPSAEDKALDIFAEAMIEKIESFNGEWQKPWFTEGSMQWPRNLNGREYNGMNALLLMMQSEKQKYQTTRYGTYNSFQRLNVKDAKDGEPLPDVHVKQGEKSYPVMLTTFTCVDKETRERIRYDDYKNLDAEEQKNYDVYPKLQVFHVFNIDQTNLKEVRPELWKKLTASEVKPHHVLEGESYSFEPVDKMIRDNEWICPIKPTYGDDAYFSISRNEIVVPEKQQFKDGESFYTSLFHEMGHSTGHETQLGRLKPSSFGSAEYAREELVAELTAAITGQRYGMSKHIKEDSAAYLKSWLRSLQEDPKYIKTVLMDVKKASQILSQNINRVALEIGKGQQQTVGQEESQNDIAPQKKEASVYYSSVAYLQSTDDTQRLDEMLNGQDYDGILAEATHYDQGDAPNLEHTYLSPLKNRYDDLLAENDHYAVVYNASVGGTYEIFAKITEEQVKDNLIRYGLEDNASPDVAAVAARMEEVSELQTVPENAEAIHAKELPGANEEQEQSIQTPQEYFSTFVRSVTDGNHEGHTALDISTMSELKEYFRDHDKIGEWISSASDSEIMEAGASLLPKMASSHTAASALQPESEDNYYMLVKTVADKNDVALMEHLFGNSTTLGTMTAIAAVKQVDTKEIDQRMVSSQISSAAQNNVLYRDDKYIAVKDEKNNLEIYKTLTKETLLDEISQNGLSPDAHPDVKELVAQVAHEDSNVQTDVAGLAKEIAETGVPMAEAEKKAKTIADNKIHEEYHQTQEDMQQTQEPKLTPEQKVEQKEDQRTLQKEAVQAALLLGALASAKENHGVWMNKEEKANATFLFSKTPIMAYNNIMLNLASDQKGYLTNVYEFHQAAGKEGVDVRQGEKATPFNWVRWDYQNVKDRGDIITKAQYEQLPDDQKGVYENYATRQTQHVFNIDQTTLQSANKELFSQTVSMYGGRNASNGQEVKEGKGAKESSLLRQWKELKAKHPDALLLFRTGDFYETYKDDAEKAASTLGLTVTQSGMKDKSGERVKMAGFPYHALDVYLPKLIRAGNRVAICDQLESPKKTNGTTEQRMRNREESKAIIDQAHATAKNVMTQMGGKFERIMVLQPAMYDKNEDKITVSGVNEQTVGNERSAAIGKANDIYRAVVAATGTEERLSRSGRNSLLPEDDAKHERLVQELAAGVLMARQGLPATFSKESQMLIPYWEREMKENPKFVNVIERDVNNAIETIDNLLQKRTVNYEAIRNQLPSKMLMASPKDYSITTDLSKLPNGSTKEVVVVRDAKEKTADVILPAGASLDAQTEISGMRKDRIANALRKEGMQHVRFYNAGGFLVLKQPNEYFQDKEVAMAKMKQYQLLTIRTIDVKEQAKPSPKVELEKFVAIKDDNGKYAFFIKPKDEPSFAVYPPKEHMDKYFAALKTQEPQITHMALANKWYEIATKDPSVKHDLITPRKVDVDMSRIVKPTITSSAEDKSRKLVIATIDGKRETASITKTQWNKMWLADDMAAYKRAIAAIAFEPILRKGEQKGETIKEGQSLPKAIETVGPPKEEAREAESIEGSRPRGMHF